MTTHTTAEFPIGFSSSTFYVVALGPGAVAAGLIYAGTRWSPSYLFFGLGGLVGAIAILFVVLAYSMNRMSLRVTDTAVELDQGLRTRSIPYSELKLEQARKVDLQRHPDLAPVRRTNGSDVPGLKQGWFQLKNGEKALLMLTNPQEAVYIPTTNGYSLLVSPTNASSFLTTLTEHRAAI